MDLLNRKELKKFFDDSSDNVTGVRYAKKIKNGVVTDELSIVHSVMKKKSIGDVDVKDRIPPYIAIDGQLFKTDVVEETLPVMMTCYTDSNNPNIQRLRGNPILLSPTKGGNQILQFPTGWQPAPGGGFYTSVGTLGFFAVDNYDNKVVGVTNSHVACYNRLYCSERDPNSELIDPYNTAQLHPWTNVQPNEYYPGAVVTNGVNLYLGYQYLKRYQPVTNDGMNFVDCALMIGNSESGWVDSASYQMWGPTDVTQNTQYMPFATTSEIDNLLSTNPNLYSTGRTTGPKGWGPGSSCILRCSAVNEYTVVSDGAFNQDWGDCIRFQYLDTSPDPVAGGDSGSCIWADFSGTWKIIGLVFAGNPTYRYGLANRIDRVASVMNIRAWDASYVLDKNYPAQTLITGFAPGSPEAAMATKTINGVVFWQAGYGT
jgi:hypothetical protein